MKRIGLLPLLATALSCGDAPSRALSAVDALRGYGTTRAVVTGDGEFILFRTGSAGAPLVVCDRHLRGVKKRTPGPIALANSGRRESVVLALVGEGERLEVWEVPTLTPVRQCSMGPDAAVMLVGRSLLSPTEEGWAWINTVGQVMCIDAESLDRRRHGRAKTKLVHAAAVDNETQRLVLCGDENLVEVFDLHTMETRRCITVDGMRVGWSLEARDGVAYVATQDGVIVLVDVANGKILQQVPVWSGTGDRSIALDLGPSGQYLAACATLFVHGNKRPIAMKLFRVEHHTLTEVAAGQAEVTETPNGITLVEGAHSVVLHTSAPVLAWQYEEPRGG